MLSMSMYFQYELLELGHAIYVGPECSSQVNDNRTKKSIHLNNFHTNMLMGCFGDCSVRVSNELGAAHPRVAKFSVLVVNGTSILISIVFCAIVLIFRVALSKLFTSDSEVIENVSSLTPLLAISVFLNGIQPILSGNKTYKHKHHFWFNGILASPVGYSYPMSCDEDSG